MSNNAEDTNMDGADEDENMFSLSHVGSIVVKSEPAESPRIVIGHRGPIPSRNLSLFDRRMGRLSGGSARSSISEDADDASVPSDCRSMNSIEKSPYEPGQDAEKGEALFDEMKELLADCTGDEYAIPSRRTVSVFGSDHAQPLVRANALIDKSGMVFSQEWVKGNIRGFPVGAVPPDLLLMCLVSKRFAKAGELLLSGISRDLDAFHLVKEAMREWGLETQYPKISNCSAKNLPFTLRKRDCYKCEIFVARAYSCAKALGKKQLDSVLLSKIVQCLDIMESRLPESIPSKRKKRKLEDTNEVIQTEESADAPLTVLPPPAPSPPPPPQPPKRKRGRPRKHKPIIEPVKPPPEENNDDSDYKEEEEEDEALAVAPVREMEAKPPARGRRVAGNNGKNKPSVRQLIASFEEKYEAMGKLFNEMGQILEDLKHQAHGSSVSEDEIRAELLKEMQETIVQKLGKR